MILNINNSCLNQSDLSVYSKTVKELYEGSEDTLGQVQNKVKNSCKVFKKKRKAEEQRWPENKLNQLKQKNLKYLNKIQILRNPVKKKGFEIDKKFTMKTMRWKGSPSNSLKRKNDLTPFYSYQNNDTR